MLLNVIQQALQELQCSVTEGELKKELLNQSLRPVFATPQSQPRDPVVVFMLSLYEIHFL